MVDYNSILGTTTKPKQQKISNPYKDQSLFKSTPQTFQEWIIQSSKAYPTQLWIAFYLLLIGAIAGTSVFLDRTNIPRQIMNMVRRQQGSPMIADVQVNQSHIGITNQAGLITLMTYPNGKRAGITDDGLQYLEIPQVSFSQFLQEGNAAWSMIATNPPAGTIKLSYASAEPGMYSSTIRFTDSQGKQKDIKIPIDISSSQNVLATITYSPENLEAIQVFTQ